MIFGYQNLYLSSKGATYFYLRSLIYFFVKSLCYVKNQHVKQNIQETCNFKIVANISYKTIAYFLQHWRLFRSDIDISFSSCSCSLPTNSFGVFSQRKVHFSTVPAVCAKLFLLHDIGLFASKSMEFISIALNYFLWKSFCV